MIKLLGITGNKGCGKTTVSKYLELEHNFTRISFADPLKCMLLSLGISIEELWGEKKEIPSDLLGGQTPRHAMQTLGTEWGRDLIHPDLWVAAWELLVTKCPTPVVVDDLRFLNESRAIKKLGGRIILLDRPSTANQDLHQSEVEMKEIFYDRKITNASSIEGLREQIKSVITEDRGKMHKGISKLNSPG